MTDSQNVYLVKWESGGYDYDLTVDSVHRTEEGAIEAKNGLVESARQKPMFKEATEKSATKTEVNIAGTTSEIYVEERELEE